MMIEIAYIPKRAKITQGVTSPVYSNYLLGSIIPGGIPDRDTGVVKGGIDVNEGRFPIPPGRVEGGGMPSM